MSYSLIDCFDFTPTYNYPGYRQGDSFLLGRIEDGRLTQLFTASKLRMKGAACILANDKELAGRGESLSQLNELDISKFHPYQLEFLHYLLVDDKYPLSNDVLDYLVETGQVVQSWVDWYRE